MSKRAPPSSRTPVNLQLQQKKLNELFSQVAACVNKKVSDNTSLQKFKKAFRSVQPQNLKGGKLKQYQKQALIWMIELAYKKMNGILADDMGLGKTIQTISYLAYLKQQHEISGKHLIICPMTVCNNWQREIQKWMPSLHVEILWGTQEERQHGLKTIVRPRKFDVLIAPYHCAVRVKEILKKIPWQALIIDEAHKLKNDEAMLTQGIKQFKAQFKLLLTGTPLSNNLRELWSLLNFIMPEIFDDKMLFDEIQSGINEHAGDENQKFDIQCRIAKKFHGIIRPFILRRTKKQINLGLPPKTEHTLYVSMTKLQLKLYKNYLKYKSVYGPGRGAQTNSQMTARKICCHPYLFEGVEDEKAGLYGEHLVENCGKMIVLDKLLEKLILKQKRKILIFSQFKVQMNVLQDFCNMRNYMYFRLDGDTDIQERQEMMKAFNEDDNYAIPIFMLSTRAGGLGINLVAASVVIIYDIDWNPQNDAQAMDRAYRIGQTKPVNVYKMVTQHTIEERMLEVQKYKLIWDELVIQKGSIMNIKSDDIFSGLNYEKIANMKKGEIFKIQSSKDNKTIDQIIKMGHTKDDKKYKEIKEKVMKQIEQQQNKQSFSANPFEDIQMKDEEGDKLLKKFQGENVGNVKKVDQNSFKTDKRSKYNFMSNLNVPEFHLFQQLEQYKELLWQREKRNKQIQKMMDNQDDDQFDEKKQTLEKQIVQISKKVEKMEEKAFTNWQKDEFNTFVEQQKKEISSQVNNLKKLCELIPTKTSKQITQYKKAFYTIDLGKQLPKMLKTRKQILNKQQNNKTNKQKTVFHEFLVKNKASFYKPKSTIQNMINNLRIENGFEDEKEFLQSDLYLTDPNILLMKQFLGPMEYEHYQSTLMSSKQLLRKFFNNKVNTFGDVIQNPELKNKINEDFEQRKKRILAQVDRKIFKKQDSNKKPKPKSKPRSAKKNKVQVQNMQSQMAVPQSSDVYLMG